MCHGFKKKSKPPITFNESVSGGQAPPTFSPYFMNAHFFWEHTLYGHCVIPFRAVFHISLTGKYKGCSSISLYSKKKKEKRRKKRSKIVYFPLFFPRTTDSRMDVLSFRLLIYKKGRLFFNRNKILYVTSIFFTLCHPLYFFLSFLPESKRTLVRNCTDFH